jgi:hypothetical protein
MFEKQKDSPYRSSGYHSLEHSKQNTVKQLELVFTYYAGKGSKYSYLELPEKYFSEMAGQLMQLGHMEVNKRSSKWMSITTLYYTKGNHAAMQVAPILCISDSF